MDVLIVFPTEWDYKQLDPIRGGWRAGFHPHFTEPRDSDCRWDFDVPAFIDQTIQASRGSVAGVFSSSDYPGATCAGAIASALGLPGTPADILLRSAHKYYSRLAQREVAAEATPWFTLIDSEGRLRAGPPPAYPCFIKPVKGSFSVMSGRLNSAVELEAFIGRPSAHWFMCAYMVIFNRLVERFAHLEIDGSHFLVEDLLHGQMATVEGYCAEKDVHVIGVVDSVMHPGTSSFARFDYPSSLPAPVQQRMRDITRRVILRLGLRHTMFNIEMIYHPEREDVHIIEVNPRICGQFADLYEKVDGVNGYEIAFALATGSAPPRRSSGHCRVASSVPLRVFEPVRVRRAPSPQQVRTAEAMIPGTIICSECQAGDVLSDFESLEDGQSVRYAVVNVGANDRAELDAHLEDIQRHLDYEFEALPG